MRHGPRSDLVYKPIERNHRFMAGLFMVLGALVFGSAILCALGLIHPLA